MSKSPAFLGKKMPSPGHEPVSHGYGELGDALTLGGQLEILAELLEVSKGASLQRDGPKGCPVFYCVLTWWPPVWYGGDGGRRMHLQHGWLLAPLWEG